MSSAKFSTGLSGDRNSSRVLQPPGGRSNIFGGYDDNQTSGAASAEEKSQKPQTTKDNIFGTADESEKPVSSNNNKMSNVFNTGTDGDQENQKTKKQGAFNPITGEALYAQQPKNMHTSTKVRQPPGGASSGLW